jgi:ParB family chromosome partitioning protein
LFPNLPPQPGIPTAPVEAASVATTPSEKPEMGTGAEAAGPAVPATGMDGGIENRDRHPGISLANPEEIQVNPFQPRREFDEKAIDELCSSIQANGIIQPLVVRKTPKGYELIAGERRLRASKKLGLKQVPIVIRRSSDRESLEIALIENIQRQDLNCIDEALAYFQLAEEFGLTQEEVAKRVGKERATIANHLRLLRLPEAVIDDLKRGILSFGHGKAILGLEDLEMRLRARALVVGKHLSVRETEALVDEWKKQPGAANAAESAGPSTPQDPLQSRLSNLSTELTHKWSTRVEVKGSDKKGKIIFHYRTRQDLDRILQAMQN